jgi:hypothetical protein
MQKVCPFIRPDLIGQLDTVTFFQFGCPWIAILPGKLGDQIFTSPILHVAMCNRDVRDFGRPMVNIFKTAIVGFSFGKGDLGNQSSFPEIFWPSRRLTKFCAFSP